MCFRWCRRRGSKHRNRLRLFSHRCGKTLQINANLRVSGHSHFVPIRNFPHPSTRFLSPIVPKNRPVFISFLFIDIQEPFQLVCTVSTLGNFEAGCNCQYGQHNMQFARRRYVGQTEPHFDDSFDVVDGYSVKIGSACQISLAYSAMVWSLENLPDAARFRIALRDHAGWSAYNSPSR